MRCVDIQYLKAPFFQILLFVPQHVDDGISIAAIYIHKTRSSLLYLPEMTFQARTLKRVSFLGPKRHEYFSDPDEEWSCESYHAF